MPLGRVPNENKEVFAVKGISQHLYLPTVSRVRSRTKKHCTSVCLSPDEERSIVTGSIRNEGEQVGHAVIGQAQWT